MAKRLFPMNLAERDWSEFAAEGFPRPVTGAMYRGTNPPVCGVPLGAIDTGCLDLEPSGLLGYCTIFNSHLPHRGPLNLPFLGIGIGLQTWVLTTLDIRTRDWLQWRDLRHWRYYRGIRTAKEIHYWGHYPVADLEYELDEAPVEVGLRAWSPFLPGDAAASNVPGAIFEVHLRNPGEKKQAGTLAFSFPGPNEEEAGGSSLARRQVDGWFAGTVVESAMASYALGVAGRERVRTGGELGMDGTAWSSIEDRLPLGSRQPGSSVAAEFSLEPGEEQIVRFVLAWYSPQWRGSGSPAGGGYAYTHRYAARFADVLAVAEHLSHDHAPLLSRVLSWQQAIYDDASLPAWLRDALVNNLYHVPETSFWAQAKPPIGDWCRPEDGLFAMSESPRWCPQIECIPCAFYGTVPIQYFFPDLARSTLRGYVAYQFPSGQAPFIWGDPRPDNNPYEMVMVREGYDRKPQVSLDGPSYVSMAERLWLRTGDRADLEEFYDSVKRNTAFTMNLRPGSGAAGIVSMPAGNEGQDWYENCDLFGIVPHVGGAHLAQLGIARRMALAIGDTAFARQCEEWIAQGSEVIEREAWAGTHYLLFNEPETGRRSDVVLGYVLDGECIARFHGLAGVFREDRVSTTLDTIARTSVARSPFGALVFCKPTAEELGAGDWDPGYWGAQGVAPVGTIMLAMTYIYHGRRDFGMDLAHRLVREILRRGWYWDWPTVIGGTEGPRGGFDYYQNMMLWILPSALAGTDVAGPCRPGGLVDRVLAAAGERS
jgi:uncharacterized protein (DUF608 family)